MIFSIIMDMARASVTIIQEVVMWLTTVKF